jgi:hypothetical protein
MDTGGLARVFIPGPLPGMNEILAAAKSGNGRRNGYGRLKATWNAVVATHARRALAPGVFERVRLHCMWIEKDRRRDPDNVTAAVKFILDGLVDAGILRGDGWSCVVGIEHDWAVGGDRSAPGVFVSLEPA